jgi:SAM-dependent methyltransferase
MPKIQPFEQNIERYEEWFDRYRLAYSSELEAVRALLPETGDGLEVGVGTGRFAGPLGVRVGVEPSPAMARLAIERGVEVWSGAAEALPCEDSSFDYLLMVVTVCFLDDVYRSFREAYRVLKPGGHILIGFIDRLSPLGRAYEKLREENVFYREATFFSTDEVLFYLSQAGFGEFVFRQTIFQHPAEMKEPEPSKEGYGEGSFVVVRGERLIGANEDS